MSISRWTPATTGDVRPVTDGLFQVSYNWTPAQIPASGNTGLITYGGLTSIGSKIDQLTLLALPAQSQPATVLNFQDTLLGPAAFLIVDSTRGGSTIDISLTFSFENDGVIDLIGNSISVGTLFATSFVNKGTINFRGSAQLLGASGALENDGTITLANPFATTVSTSVSGNGRVILKPGSTVEVKGAIGSGQAITLASGADAHSTIQIDNAPTFAGTLSGFATGDTILLRNVTGPVTSASYQQSGAHAGSLTVSTGSGSATLRFVGDYQQSDFTVASGSAGVSVSTGRSDTGIANSDEVYRFFDTSNGTHFFTADVSERDSILSSRGDLNYEGVGLGSVDAASAGAAPVYRFFDSNFGTHFYTASSTERDSVIASRSDLTFEGTGFYGHTSQQAGDAAVYRFFDTKFGTHFYTGSQAEATSIQATRADLTYEGVGFYAPSS